MKLSDMRDLWGFSVTQRLLLLATTSVCHCAASNFKCRLRWTKRIQVYMSKRGTCPLEKATIGSSFQSEITPVTKQQQPSISEATKIFTLLLCNRQAYTLQQQNAVGSDAPYALFVFIFLWTLKFFYLGHVKNLLYNTIQYNTICLARG